MPRIYTSANNPLDFCRKHFPSEAEAADDPDFQDGDGPDGRGNCFDWNADHPDYDDEDYTCEKCGVMLTSEDNEIERDDQ